jgi:hypothetical protein
VGVAVTVIVVEAVTVALEVTVAVVVTRGATTGGAGFRVPSTTRPMVIIVMIPRAVPTAVAITQGGNAIR